MPSSRTRQRRCCPPSRPVASPGVRFLGVERGFPWRGLPLGSSSPGLVPGRSVGDPRSGVQARAGAGRWPGAAVAGGLRCPRRDSRSWSLRARGRDRWRACNAVLRRWGGHSSFSGRRRQHLLDRPALAAPAEQCLDPEARPLRPLDKGERLPVPREHVNAAVRHRGRRPVIAGRPGMRQVPEPVEPSPLGVLAQGQVGLSFQPAPELLVGVGPLVACGVPPRASLVGHARTSSTSIPGPVGRPARQVDGK
jgi:hypothetical protein